MILTDGIDIFTYNGGSTTDDQTPIEKTISTTAGGQLRGQVAGKRFVDTIQLRLQETEYLNLNNLLNKPVANYDYTPTFIPAYLSASDFPMPVSVEAPTKQRISGGGTRKFWVELKISSVSYL